MSKRKDKPYNGYKKPASKVTRSKVQKRKELNIYAAVFGVAAIYIGLILATAFHHGCNLLTAIDWIQKNPTRIELVSETPKTVMLVLAVYAITFLYFVTAAKNTRYGEEHGSSQWGDPFEINKIYSNRVNFSENKILTQNVSISFDGHSHRRNLNTVVIGGAGAGKTKFIIQPNLLQCNTSYIVPDPKGESLNDNGNLLFQNGYKVKVLNLKEPEKSDCYNPFVYIQSDDDVQSIATMLIKATTPKDSKSSDPYWDQQAEMLLKAFMFLLYYEAPPEEQNFPFLMELLREAIVIEGKETDKSPVDLIFDEIEEKNPDHIALKYYKDVRPVPGKTYNTIVSVLKGKLEKFNLESIARITSTNDIDMIAIGKEKTALFIVIPDNDTSYNFLISILYLQLFKQLEDYADSLPTKMLPVHTQFLMDEFANVALPNDFEKTLSVSRSRGFSFTIILQNLSQLQALYKYEWKSIIGNCDSFVYLGGNEQESQKYVSELLGKETIVVRNYSKSTGRNGSYSTSEQLTGRELLTPDEVRKLNNDYAILFVRGSDPVIDKKYDVWTHKNAVYTPLKGGQGYDNLGNLKSKLTTASVKQVDEEKFDGTIIDFDKMLCDIEIEADKIRRANYLL